LREPFLFTSGIVQCFQAVSDASLDIDRFPGDAVLDKPTKVDSHMRMANIQ